MSLPQRRQLATGSKAFPAILSDRLEQPVARFGRSEFRCDQRLDDELIEQLEYLLALDAIPAADVFGRLQRPAAGEHRQTAEEAALLVGQQRVAPVDRGAHGLVARL